MTRTLTPRRALAGVLVALIGAVTAVVGAAPAGATAGIGYVRLAHLSPDTPAVDVYLSSLSGSMKQQVFPAVGYGVVSAYLPLAPGGYAVAMRTQGSPAASPPVLSTEVTVTGGRAYTVAGVGRYADLGLRVINDDLAPPPSGQAKVRVVQASIKAPVLTITTTSGALIGDNVNFASTTDYRDVDSGSWSLRLAPQPTGTAQQSQVRLSAGGVYSLIVLDGTAGLSTVLRPDALGPGAAPGGGVSTGGGGTAPKPLPWALILVGALGVALLGTGVLLLRQRGRGVRSQ